MNKPYVMSVVLSVMLCILNVSASTAQANEESQIYSVEWSKDGSRFVTTASDGLTIYDASLNVVAFQEFPEILAFTRPDVALSPNGDRLYAGRRRIDPRIVDPTPLQEYCTSNYSALVCEQHAIVETTNLELLANLNTISAISYTAEWSNDGLSIAFRSDDDHSTNIYNAIDGALLHSFSAPPTIWIVGYEGGVEWSPNNLYFARAGGDTVFILDASTGEIATQYQFEDEAILDAVWSPDSAHLAILTTAQVALGTLGSVPDSNSINGARRNSIIIFDVATEHVVVNINQPIVSLSALIVWSPDGNQIAAHGGRSRVYIWDANTGSLLDSFQALPYLNRTLGYSPYGGRLMIGLTSSPITGVDPDFVPLSSFMQSELNGHVQIVAPDASPERLSSILGNCANDTELIAAGKALIDAQQYNEFIEWVDQQSATDIPTICAADLRFVALSLLNE